MRLLFVSFVDSVNSSGQDPVSQRCLGGEDSSQVTIPSASLFHNFPSILYMYVASISEYVHVIWLFTFDISPQY